MIQKHLQNPFFNSYTSHIRFGKLAGTHLERLKATNTNNRYLGLITATQPLYTAYMNSLSAGSGTGSSRRGKTVSTDEVVTAIKSFISRKEGVLADRFPRKSAVYQTIYPKGISEYSKANKTNLPLLTDRFIKSVREHAGELGAQLAEEAQTMLDMYHSQRNQQLQAIGSVKGLATDSEAHRKALGLQLYRNLLTLLLIHADNTAAVEKYFDMSFLRKPRKEEAAAQLV